jgi:hypothetical protein
MTALRDQLLDGYSGPSKTVEIDDETTVELRSLSIDTARRLNRKVANKPEWDQEDLDLLYVIEAAYDPETGEQIFEHADVEQLRQMPASTDHWLNETIQEVTRLMTGYDMDPESEALDRVEMYLEELMETLEQADPEDISTSAQNQLSEVIQATLEVARTGQTEGKM